MGESQSLSLLILCFFLLLLNRALGVADLVSLNLEFKNLYA